MSIAFSGAAGANEKPGVTITNAKTYQWEPGLDIPLQAIATDGDGTIESVAFLIDSVHHADGALGATDTYTAPWSNVAPGTYVIRAEATDNEGAVRGKNKTITVNLPPDSARVDFPLDGEFYNEGDPILITASASDPDGAISRVEFWCDGRKTNTDKAAPWSYTWTKAPGGGPVEIYVIAQDNAGGRLQSESIWVHVNAAPSVTVSCSNWIQPGGVLSITANASDEDGSIWKVEFYLDGAILLAGDMEAPYACDWVADVPPGTYTITAVAYDDSGAITESRGRNVRVNAPPTATLTAPADGLIINQGQTIDLAVDATDPDGSIKRVEWWAGSAGVSAPVGVLTKAPWETTWDVDMGGAITLYAKARDNNSTWVRTDSVTLTVNSAPAVTLTAPGSNVTYVQGIETVSLAATASDPETAVASVEFFADGAKLGDGVYDAGSGAYAFDWTVPGGIAAGAYAITAVATDDQGAWAETALRTVTINIPPTVSIIGPADGTWYDAPATISLSAIASDADGSIRNVQFYRDGRRIGVARNAPYEFVWTDVAGGDYFITARAQDDKRTTTESAGIWVHVAAPPVCGLKAPRDGAVYRAPRTSLAVQAQASCPNAGVNIASVEFFDGATSLGFGAYDAARDRYVLQWTEAGGIALGDHVLTAVATDSQGRSTTSSARTIRINATPEVSLTVPGDLDLFTAPAVVLLEAVATDPDGTIERVQFRDGSTVLGEDTTPPYTFEWTGPAAGRHNLRARAYDNDGASTLSAVVRIDVNTPPVAVDQNATVTEDTPTAITVEILEVDGDPVTYELLSSPLHGDLAGTLPTLTYTPDENYNGPDSFTFRGSDGITWSNTGTVSITVTPVNDAPTVTVTATPTSGTAPLTVSFTAVADDVEGDPLTFAWDFGDGNTSTAQNPSHTYTTGGTLLPTVTVSDGFATGQAGVTVELLVPVTFQAEDQNGHPVTGVEVQIIDTAQVVPTGVPVGLPGNQTYTVRALASQTYGATQEVVVGSDPETVVMEFWTGTFRARDQYGVEITDAVLYVGQAYAALFTPGDLVTVPKDTTFYAMGYAEGQMARPQIVTVGGALSEYTVPFLETTLVARDQYGADVPGGQILIDRRPAGVADAGETVTLGDPCYVRWYAMVAGLKAPRTGQWLQGPAVGVHEAGPSFRTATFTALASDGATPLAGAQVELAGSTYGQFPSGSSRAVPQGVTVTLNAYVGGELVGTASVTFGAGVDAATVTTSVAP